MSCSDKIKSVSAHRLAGTMKIVRHPHILEKAARDIHIQLFVRPTSIHKEIDRENRLCVSSKESRRDERKVGIGSNGLLNTVKPIFCGHRQIVLSIAKFVAEFNQLGSKGFLGLCYKE